MGTFEHDLTKGNIWKQLVKFAVPFFISNLIQSLYSLVDLIILGHFGGTNSISAANIGGQVLVILTNLAAGLAGGGTVMIGNYLGSKQKDKINGTISTLLITLMVMAAVFMVLLFIFEHPLLRLMDTPDEAYGQAGQYMFICSIGLLFIYGYNALSAIMRGLGDSRTPMIFVIIACVINIMLDLVLVAGFHMGAGGAAFATIFAQGCSMLFCILYLKRHDFMFDFRASSFHFVKEEFHTLLRCGLPLSIQMVGTNFSFLILTTFINRAGGVDASAAAGIVNNFNGFAILPQAAFSSAAAAMIAQNMGKGDIKRSEKTMHCCLALCLGVSVIVFALMHIFPEQIFYLFGVNADVLAYGLPYIYAFSFEYIGLPFIMSFNTVSTATGNGWITLVANLTSAFLVRIPLAYFLAFVRGYGVSGIAAAIPLATIVGAIISFVFYLSGIWRKHVML